ncbi:hypothetical protein HPB52_011288 [Rhipicephalus sanguineus]|uniref:Cadherin domain-containing protein n=1 Tax=Rhipicephalus sanguineus TaxID=34632 RepID=A0A9D4Q6R9_RHISA|nr:hypothetical protein HPB52_011288 [Rhipicephalus sanguineus]
MESAAGEALAAGACGHLGLLLFLNVSLQSTEVVCPSAFECALTEWVAPRTQRRMDFWGVAFCCRSRARVSLMRGVRVMPGNHEKPLWRNVARSIHSSSYAPTMRRLRRVTVTVLDRNDSPPRFQNGPYVLSLSEDTPVGTTVTVLEAHDPDLEGSVRFGIAGQLEDTGGRFEVDPLSGALVLAEPLDRELQAQHQFHVTATDGVQSQEALVTIEASPAIISG